VAHEWLLKNIPMDKRILEKFLKAGFLDNHIFNTTEEGFPQGSPISPTLANMTLYGLMDHIGGKFLMTRYADDFVIAGGTLSYSYVSGSFQIHTLSCMEDNVAYASKET
jgi:RNA-directed DNA polymerase